MVALLIRICLLAAFCFVLRHALQLWNKHLKGKAQLLAAALKHGGVSYVNMRVSVQALNDSMFGNTECYEGEGLEEDQEYAPSSKRHQHDSGSE